METLKQLSNYLNKPVSIVCKDNLPRLMSYVLPHLASQVNRSADERSQVDIGAFRKSEKMNLVISKGLEQGKMDLNVELNEHIAEVLAQVLKYCNIVSSFYVLLAQ